MSLQVSSKIEVHMRGADAGQSWLLGPQASILHYARGLAQAAADGTPVLDAVITVSRARLCITNVAVINEPCVQDV